MTLYLASASPRRREILAAAGIAFVPRPAGVDETRLPGEDRRSCVARLARAKARHVWDQVGSEAGAAVLAADTSVLLDGEMLGKPRDAADAARMLARISGRAHEVLTAFCIVTAAGEIRRLASTMVRIRELSAGEIGAYVATGDPLDKAGAYAIQGPMGAVLVESVHGSYSNVIGLPLAETLEALREAGALG
ncbi:MAG: Maf family protein [Deltaproteobacteria bacterium]|jgi:septum formation protein|nr:Maf family protein [Deltaproteobacteria bacterium]